MVEEHYIRPWTLMMRMFLRGDEVFLGHEFVPEELVSQSLCRSSLANWLWSDDFTAIYCRLDD